MKGPLVPFLKVSAPNASSLVDQVPVEEANMAISKCGLAEDTGPFKNLSEAENPLRTGREELRR